MRFLDCISRWMAVIRDLILLQLLIVYSFIEVFVRGLIPVKPKSLKEEVVLITGSANGIGRHICLRLAKSEAKLVCWDIGKRENEALVDELKSMGADATGFEVDVSDISQVQRAAQQVKDQVGPVTVVINNAGIMPCHAFLGHNPREIMRAFEVNVYGPLWIIKEFLPGMMERNKGHIVTVCSSAGVDSARNMVAYSASKHAINGAMESLREELREHPSKPNIVITTAYPTPCNTSFSQNVIHTRYPWLVPTMTQPTYVANKIVDGLLKEKTHVYIPPALGWVVLLQRLLPAKATKMLKDTIGVYVEPRNNVKVVETVKERKKK